MTCQITQALLEIYIDDEATIEQAKQIKEHLSKCETCRNEYEDIILLKELLANQRISPVSEEYWDETTRLIMAKTIESDSSAAIIPLHQDKSQKKSAFYKSLISVAASLFILITSIMLGNNKEDSNFTRELSIDQPIFSIVPEENDKLLSEYVSNETQLKQMGGQIILGAPGLVGRANLILEMNQLESK